MGFRHFKLRIIFYLLAISLGIFGLIYYSFIELNYIRMFFLGLFILLMLIALFYYINKTNRDLSFFLNAVLHDDFTTKYPENHKGSSFNELYKTFTKINQKFIRQSQQEASEYQYIVTLISQMQIGVLIYDDQHRVHLVNDALTTLINKNQIIDLKGIKGSSKDLYECIEQIKSNQRMTLRTVIGQQDHEFSLAASEMRMKQRHYKIVSVQDIKAELDTNEIQSWHKLIRVLTHEIMNSVSPISSLSSSLKSLINQPEETNTVIEGLNAIEQRSRSLLSFTDSYRKLTKVPVPKIELIDPETFFNSIMQLFKAQFDLQNINFNLRLNTHSEFKADPILLEQVMINLIKNAIEACGEHGRISLIYDLLNNKTTIMIKDNGPGIPDNLRDQVFIPFYTTKAEGSGIGLSLSRQIISQHQGNLTFTTDNSGTCFKIEI